MQNRNFSIETIFIDRLTHLTFIWDRDKTVRVFRVNRYHDYEPQEWIQVEEFTWAETPTEEEVLRDISEFVDWTTHPGPFPPW